MNEPWHLGRMAALDFECSDKNPLTARIVTCALIGVGAGMPANTLRWLVNPGIAQEPGAIAVHGITDEYAAEHGEPAGMAVPEIARNVAQAVELGHPLVGHNIGFDLTLLDLASARVAWLMGDIAHRPASARPGWVRALRDGGARFDLLAGVSLEELFELQQGWHAQWAENFEAYLRKSDAQASIDRSWPLKPLTEAVAR